MIFTIDDLQIPARRAFADIDSNLLPHILRYTGLRESDIVGYRIVRRGVDARNLRGQGVCLTYRLHLEIRNGIYLRCKHSPAQPLETYIPCTKSN